MNYNLYPAVDETYQFPPLVREAIAEAPEVYASYVPKWKPLTHYSANEKVMNPGGDIVSAKIDFTTTEVYSDNDWSLSPSYATPTTLAAAVTPKLDKAEAAETYALKGAIGGDSAVRDARAGTYNFKERHTTRIRAALANVAIKQGHAKIGFLGDSTVLGAVPPSGAAYPYSFPTLLRQFLDGAGYPKTGTGLVAANQNLPYAEPRITWYSGVTALSLASNMAVNTTTLNGVQFSTVNSGEKGVVVDIYYDNTSSPFDVAVDGGARQRVTPNNTSTIGVYTIAGLPDTTHEVTTYRVTGTMRILGFDLGYFAGFGVKMYNSAVSGLKATHLKSSAYSSVVSTVASANGWSADLTFLTCITNDAGGATPVADYKTDLQSVITQLKATGTDIILTTGVPNNNVDMLPYTEVLFELSLINDIPVIDTLELMGSWARANALGLMKDDAHCTQKGYATLARAIYKALPV